MFRYFVLWPLIALFSTQLTSGFSLTNEEISDHSLRYLEANGLNLEFSKSSLGTNWQSLPDETGKQKLLVHFDEEIPDHYLCVDLEDKSVILSAEGNESSCDWLQILDGEYYDLQNVALGEQGYLQRRKEAVIVGPKNPANRWLQLDFTGKKTSDIRSAKNEYIVIFKKNVTGEIADFTESVEMQQGMVLRRYHKVFSGMHIKISPEGLKNLPLDAIAKIEANSEIYPAETALSWGLDRIDQRNLPLDKSFVPTGTGKEVHVYVVDSGINSTHNDFKGRIGDGVSFVSGDTSIEDCMGHGTHVSGTILGTKYGIAKEATLHPVRIFSCSGSATMASVLGGVEWILNYGKKPGIVNMSISGGANSALDSAVKSLTSGGFPVAVAAGNSNNDACQYSPAREPTAITVGSSAIDDTKSSFSNWGNCVDLFAPGSSIISDAIYTTSGTTIKSGTSMATPHVAGVLALLAENMPNASVANITNVLLTNTSSDLINLLGYAAPNRFLYMQAKELGPVVTVGADRTVRQPVDIKLQGSISHTSELKSVKWTQIMVSADEALEETDSPVLRLKDLDVGSYTYRLEAEDVAGRKGFAQLTITVEPQNQKPIASPGKNITVPAGSSIVLDGSESSDLDGNIVSYSWKKVAGPKKGGIIVSPKAAVTQVTKLIAGKTAYQFKLTVTDNEGAVSSKSIMVYANRPPKVSAGKDIAIVLPKASAALSGSASDIDGKITSLNWEQISGPSSALIAKPNQSKTGISGLVKGKYVFRLTAGDNRRGTASDEVNVVVREL